MIPPETRAFIQFPEDKHPQVLHPIRIESTDPQRIVAVAEESFLPLEVSLEVDVYFEERRRFHRIHARIVSTLSGPAPRFAFETLGTPVLAESRKCYRVSQPLIELTCTLHGRVYCSIEDVSVKGFAVVTTDTFSVGDTVEAVLFDLRDRPCAGPVVIRSVQSLAEGYRYGVEVCDPVDRGASLQRMVSSLSQALQRQELRRLSASA